ncbi:OLC1v1022863C1 [Oldenlandia corymbosa var. corymbosa]|uniref:OLC1v1022863C1 n=1 Tax=Oldenlandia corymbosa var. corymbosa TaxID=529605 RepID=A0AAV1BZH6_OLDCO|nr:OLC1v1022863C1 [Oldenlandia corymbosa var. corymbosa]
MTSSRKIEVLFEDHNPKKWCVPLKEDVFIAFTEKGNHVVAAQQVFGQGSLFNPLLFGKFFDPSDAFPIWEFDADVLLSSSTSASDSGDKRSVDWKQTDSHYVLTADLPEVGKNSIQVCVEGGKIVEICGQRMLQVKDSRVKDWRGSNWWEYGFVRRIELPENADWRNVEASVISDKLLEISIPKNS